MISEALEWHLEGSRVRLNCRIGVVNHGYGGLCGCWDGGGGWYACGTKPGRLVECQEMLESFQSAR